jgi:hypothetical protein
LIILVVAVVDIFFSCVFLLQENKNDLLQIVCGYHALSLPTRGSELVFQPLEHLQPIEYRRPPVAFLGLHENNLDSLDASEVFLWLMII